MARNDGIDRTSVRNLAVSDKAVGNTQQHNEREKDSYRNPDIIPQRTAWNIHFKKPTASYTDLFAQLETAGTISTRGLKPDATHYCELVFDVNSAYFDNHGGYEFAKQFYEDAYKAAVQIVGGEQYILSAVMHADEINRAEVVTIVNRLLGREADEAYIADNLRKLNTFPDVSRKHWAYYAVMEAANAHTAILGDNESWSK